ncbi:MAG: anaerobic ribonucleoside-triphosphate reductase [Verrucomicrobiae bacterium]
MKPPQSMETTLPDNERTRCEVWTRVMGYHRPVSQFNAGKQSEHRERTPFLEERTAMRQAA